MLQIMVCRLFSTNLLSEPMLGYCQLENKLKWNFNQNAILFIHINACENIVCEMAAILSRGRGININVIQYRAKIRNWWCKKTPDNKIMDVFFDPRHCTLTTQLVHAVSNIPSTIFLGHILRMRRRKMPLDVFYRLSILWNSDTLYSSFSGRFEKWTRGAGNPVSWLLWQFSHYL